MKLYIAPNSNTSDRVLWACAYKNIACEQVDIRHMSKEEYLTINPYGYVPALELDGQLISESMAIVEYIEDVYPEPALLPASPLFRAQVREVCEYVNSTVHPAQNRSVLNFLRPELTPETMKELRAQWLTFSLQRLGQRLWLKSQFAVGNTFTLADIFVGVMYKRALGQGVAAEDLMAFSRHLDFLFQHSDIQSAAPFNEL